MVGLWIVGILLCLLLMIYLEVNGENVTECKSDIHKILTTSVIIFSGWVGVFFIIYTMFNDEE